MLLLFLFCINVNEHSTRYTKLVKKLLSGILIACGISYFTRNSFNVNNSLKYLKYSFDLYF